MNKRAILDIASYINVTEHHTLKFKTIDISQRCVHIHKSVFVSAALETYVFVFTRQNIFLHCGQLSVTNWQIVTSLRVLARVCPQFLPTFEEKRKTIIIKIIYKYLIYNWKLPQKQHYM